VQFREEQRTKHRKADHGGEQDHARAVRVSLGGVGIGIGDGFEVEAPGW
jgi:hypothetical protein